LDDFALVGRFLDCGRLWPSRDSNRVRGEPDQGFGADEGVRPTRTYVVHFYLSLARAIKRSRSSKCWGR
jgi:hypothetical protein